MILQRVRKTTIIYSTYSAHHVAVIYYSPDAGLKLKINLTKGFRAVPFDPKSRALMGFVRGVILWIGGVQQR